MSSTAPTRRSAESAPQKLTRPRQAKSVFYSPAWMVFAGLAVRLLCIVATRSYRPAPSYWHAFEMVNIGYSLAEGHGFASPWGGSHGPTAWTGPLYPFLVAFAFRLFGAFSSAAGFALLAGNSIFSALTSWTMYRIARHVFSAKVAAWSGWIWALFPYAIYWSVFWFWETTLSTFLLSLIFMLTLEMEGDHRLWPWVRYGLLWGVLALTNASTLSFLPFAGCWLAYRLYRRGQRFVAPVMLGAIMFWAVITPWLVRNYFAFGNPLLLRSGMGVNLRAGNNPDAHGSWAVNYTCNNPALLAQYNRMGEAAYDAEQGRQAREWIAEDPQSFVLLTARRVFYVWYGIPEVVLRYCQPLFIGMNVMAIGGLLLALRQRVRGVFLFASLIAVYPLIYYMTFASDRYHHPIEPELVILAMCALVSDKKADPGSCH